MWKCSMLVPGLAFAAAAAGQIAPSEVEVANLRQDVTGLAQRVADLSLRVEQLEAENNALRQKAQATSQGYATIAQLNDDVTELNRLIQSSVASAKDDTLRQVAAQIEKLARQTNAALDSFSRNPGNRPPEAAAGNTDFPKEGVKYTVQPGDTLALIAKRTGAKVQDIIGANKIADPSRIWVGQSLFIPGGK